MLDSVTTVAPYNGVHTDETDVTQKQEVFPASPILLMLSIAKRQEPEDSPDSATLRR